LCSDLKRPQALIMSDPVDAEGVGGERGAAFATDFGARGVAAAALSGGLPSSPGTPAGRSALSLASASARLPIAVAAASCHRLGPPR